MNIRFLSALPAVLATSLSPAAPADQVQAAARQLADAPNYTWVTTTQMSADGNPVEFGSGSVTGKTEKDGYTLISRETQNGAIQSVRKGEQMAMQNFQSGEWMSMEEMREQFASRGGGGGGAPDRGGKARSGGTPGRSGAGSRGFGMFGGGGMTPAEEVTALVSAAKDLKSSDDVIAGQLSPETVAQRLSFGGRGRGGDQPPAAKNASGSVKFWVKDGALVKYELQVKGTVAGRDGAERTIERTSTTEFKDIGSTKVEVPEAAKKKLGA